MQHTHLLTSDNFIRAATTGAHKDRQPPASMLPSSCHQCAPIWNEGKNCHQQPLAQTHGEVYAAVGHCCRLRHKRPSTHKQEQQPPHCCRRHCQCMPTLSQGMLGQGFQRSKQLEKLSQRNTDAEVVYNIETGL